MKRDREIAGQTLCVDEVTIRIRVRRFGNSAMTPKNWPLIRTGTFSPELIPARPKQDEGSGRMRIKGLPGR